MVLSVTSINMNNDNTLRSNNNTLRSMALAKYKYIAKKRKAQKLTEGNNYDPCIQWVSSNFYAQKYVSRVKKI